MSGFDFIGSQAFNRVNHAHESVIPNTGSLWVNLPLVKLMGIRDGISLDLTLRFRLGIVGPFGLPQNWNLNVPFVASDNSLHIDDSRYIISPTWTDSTGYTSGLEYVNNHGRQFTDTQEQLPLPYGNYNQTYQYTYSDANGCVWYFNNSGQLVMTADRYGNYLYYDYSVYGALTSIVDSFGQETTFGYGTNQLTISTPDSRTVTINYTDDGVTSVTDPIGNTTSFTYAQSGIFSLIQTITYPTGKVSTVTYTQLSYLASDGNTYTLPAVSDLEYTDSNLNLLSHYRYIYGQQSLGATFTGAFASYILSASSDGLLASNDTNYTYDVTVQMLDGDSNVLAQKDTFYNYAHVPITENTYVIDPSGASAFLQTSTAYAISGDQPNRQPTYLYPIATQQVFFADATASPVPKMLTTFAYDDYGNILSKQVFSYAADGVTTVTQTTETASYFTDGVTIFTLPSTVTTIDGITKQGIETVNTLATDNLDIAASSTSFSDDGGKTWNAWKGLAKTFDAQGRVLSETYQWQATGRTGVPSTSKKYAYQYNGTTFVLTTVATDALGNQWTTVTSTMYGAKVSTATPSGKTTTYSYDALGRILTVVKPSTSTTTHTYQCFQQDGANSVSVSNAVGYTKTKTYDALGRVIQIVDNGNPVTPTQPRTLTTRTYDLLGNVAIETDLYGNKTTCQYNSLAKPLSAVDPFGNQTAFAYDYGAGSTTNTVNGVVCKKTIVDFAGRVVTEQQLPNPQITGHGGDYTLSTEKQYTGFGKVACKNVSRIDAQGSYLLETETYSYDCDLRLFQSLFTGADGNTRAVLHVYDLNGKEISSTKTVKYSGGSTYVVNSEVRSYDAIGQLLAITNGAAQKEAYTYNGDGHMITKVLFDGTSINCSYTVDGYKASETWQTGAKQQAINYTYDTVGRLISVGDETGSIATAYSTDGVPLSTTYPDGKSVTYGLDQYSRRVKLVDTTGAATNYQYTALNQLSTVTNNVDSITYQYYSDVTSNTLFGAAKGLTVAGKYTETYYYDGQNRVAKTVKMTPDNQILLLEDTSYDALNQVVSSKLSSALIDTASLNYSRTFSYDSFKQLTADAVLDPKKSLSTQTGFQYDGNGNVLMKTATAGATVFDYNAIDQLVQYTGPSGGAKSLTYTTNGELLVDGDGNEYTYDLFGRLQQFKQGTEGIAYAYYPNQQMATRAGPASTVKFYYDTQHVAVNSLLNGAATGFLAVGSRRFASYVSGAAQQYFVGNARQDTVATFPPGGPSNLDATYYEAYGSAVMGNCGLDRGNSFGWNQEYGDLDSGLVYLRSRYYDPRVMRFISRDTKFVANRYAYCHGDPINNVDPTGHDAIEAVEIGVGVGLGLGAVAGLAYVYFSVAAVAGGAGAIGAAVAGAGAAAAAAAAGLGAPLIAAAAGVGAAATAVATGSVGLGAGAGAVAGASIGAYVGAVAGVQGVAIGGLIGGTVGAIAGNTIASSSAAIGAAASSAATAVGDTVAAAGATVSAAASSAAATASAAMSSSMATVGAATAAVADTAADAAAAAAGAVGITTILEAFAMMSLPFGI